MADQNKQSQVSQPDYTDGKIFDEIKKYISHIITFDLVNEAYNINKSLPSILAKIPDFEKKFSNLKERYDNIVLKASFVAIPLLHEQKIIDVFEKNFKEVLDIPDIIIEDKIEAKLVSMLHEQRDGLKEKIRGAMERNTQKISEKNVNTGGQIKEPTIGNWVRDYVSHVGIKPADSVEKQQYFISNTNMKKLSPEEKVLVTKILNFYELLKLSSTSMEGMEEHIGVLTEDGKHLILNRGRMEEVHTDAMYKAVVAVSQGKMTAREARRYYIEGKRSQEELEKMPKLEKDDITNDILDAYKGDEKMNKKIAQAESAISNKSGQDIKTLREEFYKAVQNKKVERVIAILRLMVQLDDLEKFLSEDEKLKKYISAMLPESFGKEAADAFNSDPTSGQSVQLFVQYILQERLGMQEHDSARVGMQLSNLFKQQGKLKYSNFAYFDMQSKKFKWYEEHE